MLEYKIFEGRGALLKHAAPIKPSAITSRDKKNPTDNEHKTTAESLK